MSSSELAAYVGALTYCVAMRIFELWLSRRNEARIIAAGGVRIRPDATGPLVIVHAAWFAGLLVEGLVLGPHHVGAGVRTAAWIGAVAAELLRLACMASLGVRWNVHVVVLPGAPLRRIGPYRWLRHPNYAAVVALLVSLPLALGLPLTALLVVPAKAWALRRRLAVEDAALRAASGGSPTD